MVFLDFEKPLETLYEQLEKVRQIGEQGGIDVNPMVAELELKIKDKIKEIYANLTGWDKARFLRTVCKFTDGWQPCSQEKAFHCLT